MAMGLQKPKDSIINTLWKFWCLSNWLVDGKISKHISHLKAPEGSWEVEGVSFWVCSDNMWLFSLSFLANPLSHISQANRLTPVCSISCLFKSTLCLKDFSHIYRRQGSENNLVPEMFFFWVFHFVSFLFLFS